MIEGSPSQSGSENEQLYSGSEATGEEELQNSSASGEELEESGGDEEEVSSEDKSGSESEHDSPTSKGSCWKVNCRVCCKA